ncbi:hypothetical protein ILYODFUR_020469 [Ilyodon furcidens]|uniref:Uncharacterized protein n=1 Tax=Ilyodon furcidens TaxID=33524 RepID=A0ABV0VG83_9TELE
MNEILHLTLKITSFLRYFILLFLSSPDIPPYPKQIRLTTGFSVSRIVNWACRNTDSHSLCSGLGGGDAKQRLHLQGVDGRKRKEMMAVLTLKFRQKCAYSSVCISCLSTFAWAKWLMQKQKHWMGSVRRCSYFLFPVSFA